MLFVALFAAPRFDGGRARAALQRGRNSGAICDELYRRLAQSHFDLYARRSKADYDALFARMHASFAQPMTAFEVRVAFQKFMAFGRVAHSRIEFPSEAYRRLSRRRRAGDAAVRARRNGRVFVAENGSDAAIAAGEEIVALNGTPMRAWLERLAANVSADNDYMMGTLLENRFAPLLWLELGRSSQFRSSVREREGQARDVVVAALTREETKAALARQSADARSQLGCARFKMVGDVGYLRPGPFYNSDPNATNIWDMSAVRGFHRRLVRGADARQGSHAADRSARQSGRRQFVQRSDGRLVRDKAVPVCQATSASSSARPRSNRTASALSLVANDKDAMSAKLAAAYAQHRLGEVFSFEIPEAQPRAGARFTGKVYLLINRHSYSNTVQVAALSRDYGFATIVGEETSDLATTYRRDGAIHAAANRYRGRVPEGADHSRQRRFERARRGA